MSKFGIRYLILGAAKPKMHVWLLFGFGRPHFVFAKLLIKDVMKT
jgi:hypothetical protein